MNRRALIYGLIYSVAAIGFKLFMVLSGNINTEFGFYYSHFISILFIIPFILICVITERAANNGVLGGRHAMRMGLTIIAIAAVFMTVYNYVETSIWGREMANVYYNSPTFLKRLQADKKVLPANYGNIIKQNIELAAEGGFKSATFKLFPLLLIGISTSFIVASALRSNKPATT